MKLFGLNITTGTNPTIRDVMAKLEVMDAKLNQIIEGGVPSHVVVDGFKDDTISLKQLLINNPEGTAFKVETASHQPAIHFLNSNTLYGNTFKIENRNDDVNLLIEGGQSWIHNLLTCGAALRIDSSDNPNPGSAALHLEAGHGNCVEMWAMDNGHCLDMNSAQHGGSVINISLDSSQGNTDPAVNVDGGRHGLALKIRGGWDDGNAILVETTIGDIIKLIAGSGNGIVIQTPNGEPVVINPPTQENTKQ